MKTLKVIIEEMKQSMVAITTKVIRENTKENRQI